MYWGTGGVLGALGGYRDTLLGHCGGYWALGKVLGHYGGILGSVPGKGTVTRGEGGTRDVALALLGMGQGWGGGLRPRGPRPPAWLPSVPRCQRRQERGHGRAEGAKRCIIFFI